MSLPVSSGKEHEPLTRWSSQCLGRNGRSEMAGITTVTATPRLLSEGLPVVFLDVGLGEGGSGGRPARDVSTGCAAAAPGGTTVEHHAATTPSCCSQIAHRRRAYSWTSQHTSVVKVQVWRTMVDAPVRRGTGWWVQIPASRPGLSGLVSQRPAGISVRQDHSTQHGSDSVVVRQSHESYLAGI